MIRLAIETAQSACSVAIFNEHDCIAYQHDVMSRGHAERLIPAIAEILDAGSVHKVDEILVDVGPGSFTGVRVGVAAARALALAWQCRVRGFWSTTLLGASILAQKPDVQSLFVCIDALRGEVYTQLLTRQDKISPPAILSIEDAARQAGAQAEPVIGSGAPLLTPYMNDQNILHADIMPDARQAMNMSERLLLDQITPFYLQARSAKYPPSPPQVTSISHHGT